MKRCPNCGSVYSNMVSKCSKCNILLPGEADQGSGNARQSNGAHPQNPYQQGNYQQQYANDGRQVNNGNQQGYYGGGAAPAGGNYQQQYANDGRQVNNGNQKGYYGGGAAPAGGKMGFGEAVSTCFRKFAVFSGRASRAEYWWFTLFTYIIICIGYGLVIANVNDIVGILGLVLACVVLIPWYAAAWRRMHDIGKSGAYMLIPYYNLVLLLRKGEAFDNQYGFVPTK